MSAPSFQDIDPNEIYFREIKSTPSGGKTCYISRHPTSSDPAYNLTFKLSPDHSWHSGMNLTRAKFGVDAPQQNSNDEFKRTISLTAEHPDLVPFLKTIEEKVINFAVQHSEEFWGKKTGEEVIRDKFKSVLKESPDPNSELKPLVKTKILLSDPSKPDQKNTTKVFIAKHVIPPCDEYPSGKIDLQETFDPLNVIQKNSTCLAKVKVSSLWKSPIGFGITMILSHLIVWPGDSMDTVSNVFGFGSAEVTVSKSSVSHEPEDMEE